MSKQTFLSNLRPPPIANLTAVTATSETILWNVSRYTPIAPNDAEAGDIYEVKAGGIMSFGATGALTITPRFGLTVAAGITMGASVAKTTPGTTTNQPWTLDMNIVIRTVGDPGVNSTVMGTGVFSTNATTAAGTAVTLTFGGTSASVDLSIATGICIGWTLSVAGTCTPMYAYIRKVN